MFDFRTIATLLGNNLGTPSPCADSCIEARCQDGPKTWPNNDHRCIETIELNGVRTSYTEGGVVDTGRINETDFAINHRMNHRIVPTIGITFYKPVEIRSINITTTPCGEEAHVDPAVLIFSEYVRLLRVRRNGAHCNHELHHCFHHNKAINRQQVYFHTKSTSANLTIPCQWRICWPQ